MRKKDAVKEMTEKTIVEAPAEGPTSISTYVREYRYDIFLSFRGEDTRDNFTGYLYNALCQRGLKTFIDDEGLERGEEISPTLIKAIEESKVSIVIFSENYASSPWCLNELVKILECKREKGQMVWPIFYKVDPCDVRHQRNSYKEAMAKHENRFKSEMEKVKRWRSALNEAANLSGWTFKTGYEFELISAIILEAYAKLHCRRLYIGEHIIGLDFHLKKVLSLLNIKDDDTVRMLGIHGIGGIGKSTIAKVLYNSIVDHFDFVYFLESVRAKSNSGMGVVNVQEELLSEIFGMKDFNLGNVDKGASMIKHSLCNRKVLLMLDDVDNKEQLKNLAGGCDWFGPGSWIVITTRDKHLLRVHGIEEINDMKELNRNEALELFCWNAFKKNQPDEKYKDISNRIIDYAKGLPLALDVIGSNLFEKNLREWESALEKYQKIPDKGIQGMLRVSYDSLEDDQKAIFLDIACFFKGKRYEKVENILKACDLSPEYNIKVLVDKSLITIDTNCKLGMHDLIQSMGKEIVRQDASSKLGQYRSLWNPEHVLDVLTTDSGSDNIQAIMFHPHVPKRVEWSGTNFEKMINLRILIVRNVEFSIAPESLPKNLRVLQWDGYASESLSQGFCSSKMVLSKLQNRNLISLPMLKSEKLTYLDFSKCQQLTQIPDLSGAPNITILRLKGCTNLKEVQDSVGRHTKLRELNLASCTSLEVFPRRILMTSLEKLILKGCIRLQHFPDISGEMDKLRHIDASRTGIKQIPHSIGFLPRLHVLFLSDCHNLASLPQSINQLDRLTELYVDDCKKLQQISGFPPRVKDFIAYGCISLSSQLLNAIWSQALQQFFEVDIPRIVIPNCFDHQSEGQSISFWCQKKLPNFAFAVTITNPTNKRLSHQHFFIFEAHIYLNGQWRRGILRVTDFSYEGRIALHHFRDLDCYISSNDWIHVEIKCKSGSPYQQIEKCGVYVYKEDIKMEDIQFECPVPNNSNMDAVTSQDDAGLTEKIEEAEPRKMSHTRYMSGNDGKIAEAKPRKKSCRALLRNGKDLKANKLPRRLIKKSPTKRFGIHWLEEESLSCTLLLKISQVVVLLSFNLKIETTAIIRHLKCKHIEFTEILFEEFSGKKNK